MHECPLNIIRDKLHKGFFLNLEYDIINKPKLRIFKHLREANYLPKYISMILPRYHRSLLSQIRSATLPIRIESGRFINEPLEDRLCILSETNYVEDRGSILFYFVLNIQVADKLFFPIYRMTPFIHSAIWKK